MNYQSLNRRAFYQDLMKRLDFTELNFGDNYIGSNKTNFLRTLSIEEANSEELKRIIGSVLPIHASLKYRNNDKMYLLPERNSLTYVIPRNIAYKFLKSPKEMLDPKFTLDYFSKHFQNYCLEVETEKKIFNGDLLVFGRGYCGRVILMEDIGKMLFP